jgi:hypothetical protein
MLKFNGESAPRDTRNVNEERRKQSDKVNFNILSNIVRVIKSSRWVGHISRMEDGRSAFQILIGKPRLQEREFSESLGVDWSTILEWILIKKV